MSDLLRSPSCSHTGLAMILNDAWPGDQLTNCRLSAGDPVIIPYRELKRFMRRGAFRDELLKLNRALSICCDPVLPWWPAHTVRSRKQSMIVDSER